MYEIAVASIRAVACLDESFAGFGPEQWIALAKFLHAVCKVALQTKFALSLFLELSAELRFQLRIFESSMDSSFFRRVAEICLAKVSGA